MAFEHLRLERDGFVLTITIDRQAKLNALNGADTSAAQPALGLAEAFFATTSGTTVPKAPRTSVSSWAAQLDAYDSGLVGPGHCSE